MTPYAEHVAGKIRQAPVAGMDLDVAEPWLFPFQAHAVRWALRGGRRALFMDTGLGKSRMQLAWADRVASQAGGRVLILTPLAVGPQTMQEAISVGLSGVRFARSPADAGDARIVICNYDSMDHFDGEEFVGIVIDESSILKSFTGSTRLALTRRAAEIPYRLACTATPSPNDVEELGTHAEWLGMGTRAEMLARFFVNDSSDTGTWILKGHAVRPFWDWVASWALCASLPSDVGVYDDAGYLLPPLHVESRVVQANIAGPEGSGSLFALGGVSATTIHATKRMSASARANAASEIIAAEPGEPWILWCESNYEAETIMAAIPGAVEVSGAMSADMKSDRLLGFAQNGGVLVTKPKIAGFGLNWQHCARVVFVGGSYSYEAFYQAIRRCWRFGQKRPVIVYVLMGLAEQAMWTSVVGKSDRHADLKVQMIAASRRAQSRAETMRSYDPNHAGRLPSWLSPGDDA